MRMAMNTSIAKVTSFRRKSLALNLFCSLLELGLHISSVYTASDQTHKYLEEESKNIMRIYDKNADGKIAVSEIDAGIISHTAIYHTRWIKAHGLREDL
jgi:Ca2+-binding EF-hand superfamily protein